MGACTAWADESSSLDGRVFPVRHLQQVNRSRNYQLEAEISAVRVKPLRSSSRSFDGPMIKRQVSSVNRIVRFNCIRPVSGGTVHL